MPHARKSRTEVGKLRLSMLTQPPRGRQAPSVSALTVAVTGFAVLALLAPFGDAEQPLRRVGVLLALGGAFEVLHGIRRADTATLRRAVTSGAISLLMGLLVISAFSIAGEALVLLLAITFAADGLGYVGSARRSAGRQRRLAWLAAAGDFGAAVALVVTMRQISDTWLVALAAALRLLGIAWAMAVTPVHTTGDAAETVIDDLGLADHPEAADLLAQITVEEKVRASCRSRMGGRLHRHALRDSHRAPGAGRHAVRVRRAGHRGRRRHGARRCSSRSSSSCRCRSRS